MMEYSDLVNAIKENDSSRVEELMETLVPRLIRFLRIHMNASAADAKDTVQETLLHSLIAVKEGKVKNPDRFLSYLLTSCRNNYLKMKQKEKEYYYEEPPENRFHEPKQLQGILDEERKEVLKECLDGLKADHREFIEYWFLHPDYEAEKVAEYFNLSLSNTWTRKHRILKKLNKCYEEKSKK